jgi:drug/metabolite transporter (DMT)-like permease
MPSAPQPLGLTEVSSDARSKKLQLLGILSGFAAGAWLGAAEAPTKLVSIGISPMAISLIMVIGVFLARWSLPALILGTSSVRADIGRAPHLIIWAVLAGCLWAVANTLTIFAIRDIGLSIAFPLWNSNSLLGIFWGFLFFNELRQAGWRRSTGVLVLLTIVLLLLLFICTLVLWRTTGFH